MKLEINYMKKTGKLTNMWRLNNMLLNNQQVKEEIKREIKNYLETNENGNITSKFVGCRKSSSKREVYRNKCLPQQTRKVSNKKKNLTLPLKELETEEKMKPKVGGGK